MSWSTSDEIEFIKGLGMVKPKKRGGKPTLDREYRRKLLEGYVASIPNRVNWDKIDKEKVVAYVNRALRGVLQ